MGLVFIGITNQSSRQYPMEHLKIKYSNRRVDCYGLVSEAVDEVLSDMMVFVWIDCNRWCLIATRQSLQEVKVVLRQIWRQIFSGLNSDTHMVDLDKSQPVTAYI